MKSRTGCDGRKTCNAGAFFNSGIEIRNERLLASLYFSCTLNVARQCISGLNSTVSCLLSF